MKRDFKNNRKKQELPVWPEPFVFRIELSQISDNFRRLLKKILQEATFLQLELLAQLDSGAIEILNYLDRQDEDFSFDLIASGLGDDPVSYLDSLRRLKKLSRVGLFFSAAENELAASNTLQEIAFITHIGLKSRIVVYLDVGIKREGLEALIKQFLKAGAGEISLRLNGQGREPSKVPEISDWLLDLKARTFPLSFDECFPGIPAGLRTSDLSCRGAYGSVLITADGSLKPCRLSGLVLGNLYQNEISEIWKKVRAGDLTLCQKRAKERTSSVKKEKNEGEFEQVFYLEAKLRPINLARLKPEEWGAVLIKDLEGIVLSPQGEEIIRAVDGRADMALIKKRFGSASLSLIYALFIKGLIRFEKKEEG